MEKRPIIGIVGGVRKETLTDLPEEISQKILAEYTQQCEDLGLALAEAGMRILVWSSDSRFIERKVVDGYLKADKVLPNSVIFVWHKSHRGNMPKEEVPDSPIFRKYSPYDDWETGFYESIKEDAQGVILMGGGSTTLIVGYIAASSKIAIFATPHFGGKAESVYKILGKRLGDETILDEVERDAMSRDWTSERCIASLNRQMEKIEDQKLKDQETRKETLANKEMVAKIERKEELAIWTLILTFFFMFALANSVAGSTGSLNLLNFLIVLFSSGALGATLSVHGQKGENTQSNWTILGKGAGVGVVVAVLQLAPSSSELFNNDRTIPISTVFSGAVFALLGGLAYEAALENLIKRGEQANSRETEKNTESASAPDD